MKTPSRSQALLDLDFARELLEQAADHRVLAGHTRNTPEWDSEDIYGPDGHSKCLEDARLVIADVRGRRSWRSLYPDSFDVYDPRN